MSSYKDNWPTRENGQCVFGVNESQLLMRRLKEVKYKSEYCVWKSYIRK